MVPSGSRTSLLAAWAVVLLGCGASARASEPSVLEPEREPGGAERNPSPPASQVLLRGSCGSVCTGSANDELGESVSRRAASARACYEQELKADPAAGGRLLVTLTVADDGRPCSTQVSSSTMSVSPEFEACLKRLFDTRYAPPTGGCIRVILPLSFVPVEVPQSSEGGAVP